MLIVAVREAAAGPQEKNPDRGNKAACWGTSAIAVG
jgi:hypothetical protein